MNSNPTNFELVQPQDLDRSQWSDFVKGHPEGNIFQTPEMYDILRDAGNHKPLLIAIKDQKGEIVALQLAAIQTQYSTFPLSTLTARSIIYGTPLVDMEQPGAMDVLLQHYSTHAGKQVIYSQYRNLWQQSPQEKESFAIKDFTYEEHLDIHMDLTQTEEQLLKNMHKQRRHNIRRASNKGVTFRELTDPKEIEESYAMIANTYKRIKLPFPEKSFFDASSRHFGPGGMVKYFAAVFNEKIISVRIVLCYKKLIFDWWTGSLDEFRNKYPNDFLPWHIFLWGKAHGYTCFAFGGAGKPGVPYGVRDYKLKFGGNLVNFGRYEKIHKPLLMKTAKIGLKLWQKLKR